MDLLPSHEELDNTGFRALTGSHSTDRSSPPPGYIPDALQQVARNGSFTSINNVGPVVDEQSGELCVWKLSIVRQPVGQLLTLSSSWSAEYDLPVFEKSGKGGTYPRRYGIPFGLQDYSDGRKTFPRARRTQVHSFRSPVSFSPTEQSPSTSSGSSVFTPDLEEAPGPGRRRRGSDIEPNPNPATAPTLSVMDISPPSRCESFSWIFLDHAVLLPVFSLCLVLVLSSTRSNQLAAGEASGPGGFRSRLPLL
ncbi:hypothetical protein GOODEAATRI_009493 [Goodea atripinnis]|uniref:Uncharacterized protein n=1 Tax=Goodea atripinnis TaxID=208336 RepID=A0ABV0P310_9TELE